MRKFVISRSRPTSVARMSQVLGDYDSWTWVVPSEQFDAYMEGGAGRIMGVHSTQVTHQRQHALEVGRAHNENVVMVDDDLRKLELLHVHDGTKQSITVDEAADKMHREMVERGAHLAGVGPTNNAFFVKKSVQTKLFIRSGLVMVRPNMRALPIDYDHALKVKEDYDLTCQFLERDGVVARCDFILATFQQRSNGGGCQDYRTEQIEKAAVEYLCNKWPSAIKPHATRPNEVSLRWPTTT